MRQHVETNPEDRKQKVLRRVVIEDRQQKVLEHARLSRGYAEDLDPHTHDRETFRLINQRKDLDELPEAGYVVPALDEWKHWTKMNDWDSRNSKLEELVGKLRRKEASSGEIQLLVTVCRPAWAGVAANLRRYGGVDADPRAAGIHQREEIRRTNELDREELDAVIQSALMEALYSCPRNFPRRFFPWLRKTLSHRALDFVLADLTEHDTRLPHDTGIRDVLDRVLGGEGAETGQAFFRSQGSPAYSQWLRTLDLPAMFDLAEEYATYARIGSACRRAVDRLPDRQRQVVQNHYYEEMTHAEIAKVNRLADSSVRNSHSGALKNLRHDDDLFQVLEAAGKVRDRARREAVGGTHAIAA
jgi:RNA polymerase sigma factor (sigma-70 family)